MRYSIGIGALINDCSFNCVRSTELQISNATNNYSGLRQPPHVTLKRPFEVDGIAGIQKCEQALISLANNNRAFDIGFDGVGNFDNSVLFLRALPNNTLESLHNQLLTSLKETFPGSTVEFEGKDMVFHATLAMGLKPGQLSKAQELLKTYPDEFFAFKSSVTKLGLFLGIENNTHWIVTAEANLVDDGVNNK